MILITICGPHKYLPGFTGGITLEVILNDIEVTPEEIKAEKRKGQQTWDEMPENKKKEHLQFIYDMGSKIEEEDIKKYRIKTIY